MTSYQCRPRIKDASVRHSLNKGQHPIKYTTSTIPMRHNEHDDTCRKLRRYRGTNKFGVVLLLLLCFSTLVSTRTNTDVLGKKCTSDSGCSAPHIICRDYELVKGVNTGVCKHKPLFPMNSEEIWALVIMTFLLAISSTVAIAGGIVFVPFSLLLMGMSTKQAVAMANAITVLKASVKYIISLRTTSPKATWKTAIDYNAALVTLPTISLFSVIGGIASSVIPDFLVTLLMAAVLAQALYIGTRNWLRIRSEEKAAVQASKPGGSGSTAQVAGVVNPRAEVKELEMGPIPQEKELTTSPEFVALKDKPDMTEVAATQLEGANIISQENEKKVQQQLVIEGKNFFGPKILPILLMVMLSILVSVLRPGKNPDSLVGIHKCSAGDYLILLAYAIMMLAFPYYAYKLILKEQAHKQQIGWKKHSEEVYLDGKKMVYMNVWCSVSGLISTLLGIGGGVLLNPLLGLLHYLPSTASWTINLTALVGKIAATLVHIFFGELLYDYVLFYGVIIAFFVFWSENLAKYLMKKWGSQMIYATIFVVIVLFSLGMNLGVGIDRVNYDTSKGKNIWQFKSLC